jgi:DNA helicase HerA-like ATPase
MLRIGVSDLEQDDWRLLLGGVSQLDPLGQALCECIDVATERHGKSYEIGTLIAVANTSRLESLFQGETLRALRQKLAVLDRTGLFTTIGTPMSDLVRPGQVSIILLNRLSQENRELVVGVVSRMLFAHRQESAALEKRLAFDNTLSAEGRASMEATVRQSPPKAVLILDEAQGFLSPSAARSTRAIFTQIVKEGRNCGLSVAMATQQPGAIDRDILSQVEVFVSHQLTTDSDIRSIVDNAKAAQPEEIQFGGARQDLATVLRSLPPGYCIISASDMSDSPKRTFIARVRPRFTVHGGIEV